MKILSIFVAILSVINSQKIENYKNLGQSIRITSANALFPHSKRINGHKYGDKQFSFSEHYADSSVLIFIPKQFKLEKKTDFLFYFHGWNNTIDQSMKEFQLAEQLVESKKNLILVFPEGPKNSSDSFGGKLEEKGRFVKLMNDIKSELNKNNLPVTEIGNITLSGHSGAYRVIAYIINRGGLTENINKVIIFDGFYGQFEKYAYWLDHYKGQFINILTPNGGTWNNSSDFLENLDNWNIGYQKIISNSINKQVLDKNRITFIFTDLNHNQVVNPYLRIFLE